LVPVLLALLALAADLPDADLVEQARIEFGEGVRLRQDAAQARPHFESAARVLEELQKRGADNPLLYRNLGRSQLLAGDLPRAILSYHRGLRLAPRDRDLQLDLADARELVAFPDGRLGKPAVDTRPPWLPHLSAGYLFAVALVLYSMGWLALTRW